MDSPVGEILWKSAMLDGGMLDGGMLAVDYYTMLQKSGIGALPPRPTHPSHSNCHEFPSRLRPTLD